MSYFSSLNIFLLCNLNTIEVENLGSSIIKTLIKLILVFVFLIIAIFLVEKINFPSPETEFKIDITDEIKKL